MSILARPLLWEEIEPGVHVVTPLQFIPAEPCLPSHAGLLGSAAGDTHVSGGTLPTAWAEAREDSGEKFTNSNSHGERNG